MIELTEAQKAVIERVAEDLAENHPMTLDDALRALTDAAKTRRTDAELVRLRAIVHDLARFDPIRESRDGWVECAFCDAEGSWDYETVGPHDPSCPWLRATQEQGTTDA